MPSQPAPGTRVDLPLSRQEWDLLVRLPRQVLIAATARERRPDERRPDGRFPDERHGVDVVAGLGAIAAGHRARSLVLRGVVAAIFAERQPAERFRGRVEVLRECASAVRLLASRLGRDDATAYGHWLLDIAASAGPAAWRSRTVRLGGVTVFIAERRFLEDLGRAVRL